MLILVEKCLLYFPKYPRHDFDVSAPTDARDVSNCAIVKHVDTHFRNMNVLSVLDPLPWPRCFPPRIVERRGRKYCCFIANNRQNNCMEQIGIHIIEGRGDPYHLDTVVVLSSRKGKV